MKVILTVTLTLLLFTLSCSAQSAPPTLKKETSETNCDHDTSRIERFELIRLTAPARVTFFDNKVLESVQRDDKQIKAQTFFVDDTTKLPKDFLKVYKKHFWFILYCEKDSHVYVISELSEQQKAGTIK